MYSWLDCDNIIKMKFYTYVYTNCFLITGLETTVLLFVRVLIKVYSAISVIKSFT